MFTYQRYLLNAILIVLMTLGSFSCLENDNPTNSENIIRSEEVIYVSGERVRMLGRVLAFKDEPTDHGFEISSNAEFTSPVVVSIGPLESPGRFIAEYEGLRIGNSYYFRSYMVVSGQTIYGEVTPFNSLSPFISSFQPIVSRSNLPVRINGGNFTSDARVLVGGVAAEIREISQESQIEILLPDSVTGQFVDIEVIVQDDTLTAPSKFEYIIGRWTSLGRFPDESQIINGVSILSGNSLFFGSGYDNNIAERRSDFWQFDLTTNSWTSIGSYGPPIDEAYFISTGFGGGKLRSAFGFQEVNNAFFQLVPSGSFVVSAPFDGVGLSDAIALELGNKAYLFGGLDQFVNANFSVYESDKNNINWRRVGSIPYDITNKYPGFVYEGNFYFVLSSGLVIGYNLENDESFEVASYPDEISQSAVAHVLNDKVYIGMGRGTREIFELDLATGSWREKAVYTAEGNEFTASSWVYNNKLYIMRTNLQARNGTDPRMEVWTFEPDAF